MQAIKQRPWPASRQAGTAHTLAHSHPPLTAAAGNVRKAWLLRNHLVGFYYVRNEVDGECLIASPKAWCYGSYGGSCPECARYSPDRGSISKMISQVLLILQARVNGP